MDIRQIVANQSPGKDAFLVDFVFLLQQFLHVVEVGFNVLLLTLYILLVFFDLVFELLDAFLYILLAPLG